MSYTINRNYISKGKSRSGAKISKVRFIVAHDTGNPGSSAAGNRSYFQNSQPSASAHTFIDHKEILEIVPIDEKAWHVLYQKPIDNQIFGDDSNDAAIGVELCYGGNIDNKEAYKRYVWYMKYLCDKFGLDPKKHIVGHYTLDPGRKTDPMNAFKLLGITWNDFISDVAGEKVTSSAVKTATKQTQTKSATTTSSRKSQIKTIQSNLNSRYGLRIAVDGIPGPETNKAIVKGLQKEANNQYNAKLAVDGIPGPKTYAALPTVYEGAKGNITWLIQAILYLKGYNINGVDSIFGDGLEAGLKEFQGKNKLTKDAIVGKNTWKKLLA